MRTIIPPRLRPGDCIGIVAPASPPLSEESLERGVAHLEGRGFRVKLGRALAGKGGSTGYLAAPDRIRAGDLHAMFTDASVRAIFCARGGYGAARILPLLDYALVRKNPKILVGYSDVTALHLALFARAGLVTFAGPMVAVEMRRPMDAYTEEHFWDMLMRPVARTRIGPPPGGAFESIRPGTAEGRILGGNLALLASLCGGPFLPRSTGALLFLEDVGEKVYRIDRYLGQLSQAGILRSAAGLLFGAFSGMVPDSPSLTLEEVLRHYARQVRGPVLGNFPFGHETPKCTLPVGARARLSSRAGALTILEPVVR